MGSSDPDMPKHVLVSLGSVPSLENPGIPQMLIGILPYASLNMFWKPLLYQYFSNYVG